MRGAGSSNNLERLTSSQMADIHERRVRSNAGRPPVVQRESEQPNTAPRAVQAAAQAVAQAVTQAVTQAASQAAGAVQTGFEAARAVFNNLARNKTASSSTDAAAEGARGNPSNIDGGHSDSAVKIPVFTKNEANIGELKDYFSAILSVISELPEECETNKVYSAIAMFLREDSDNGLLNDERDRAMVSFLTEYTEGDGRGLPMVEFTSENIATRNAVRPQINAFLIKALISEFDKETASGDEENDALRTEFLNVSSPRSEANYERRKAEAERAVQEEIERDIDREVRNESHMLENCSPEQRLAIQRDLVNIERYVSAMENFEERPDIDIDALTRHSSLFVRAALVTSPIPLTREQRDRLNNSSMMISQVAMKQRNQKTVDRLNSATMLSDNKDQKLYYGLSLNSCLEHEDVKVQAAAIRLTGKGGYALPETLETQFSQDQRPEIVEALRVRDDSLVDTFRSFSTKNPLPKTVMERLANHDDPKKRAELAGSEQKLPEDIIEKFSNDVDDVREELAMRDELPSHIVRKLAKDKVEIVRARIAEGECEINPELEDLFVNDTSIVKQFFLISKRKYSLKSNNIEKLFKDPDEQVRGCLAASNQDLTDDMIETYSKGVEAVRVGLGYGDRKLKPHIVRRLAGDQSAYVREALAISKQILPDDIVWKFATDEKAVREGLASSDRDLPLGVLRVFVGDTASIKKALKRSKRKYPPEISNKLENDVDDPNVALSRLLAALGN